jgi:hypothetical protein
VFKKRIKSNDLSFIKVYRRSQVKWGGGPDIYKLHCFIILVNKIIRLTVSLRLVSFSSIIHTKQLSCAGLLGLSYPFLPLIQDLDPSVMILPT